MLIIEGGVAYQLLISILASCIIGNIWKTQISKKLNKYWCLLNYNKNVWLPIHPKIKVKTGSYDVNWNEKF